MSQLIETKSEVIINLEEPDIKSVEIKPIEVDIDEEDLEKTIEESNEKDDEPDDNDDYEIRRSKEKRRWKKLLNSTPMETYEQIISKPIAQKDYSKIQWDSDNELPIEWLDLHKAKRWFMDNMIFNKEDEFNKKSSREQVSHNLLELSRLLKLADKHIDECTDPAIKERFLNGVYLKAIKRRNQIMNIWKVKDEEGCVQFLRENPIIGKYGKRNQETKPKKN